MTIKIADLMSKSVITAQPHHTVEHVRAMMTKNHILAVPIVGADGEALGIVTSSDLMNGHNERSPINKVMTENVYKVPAYNNVDVAARIMRKHKIHHVVVTHEQQIVGIISSFDLLQLVENHRFEAKPGGAQS
ncbi:MAG: CBS domain-containing protein [Alphaproteobacteria bacterium]|nr:CBS domain-containing protein [Alphaproteobacteria bacterium]